MIAWSPAASRDFEGVREFLDQRYPASAESLSHRILEAVATLEQFPRRGRPGRRAGSRELVVARTPYIVVYRIDDDEIVILRVLHGAQQWPPQP